MAEAESPLVPGAARAMLARFLLMVAVSVGAGEITGCAKPPTVVRVRADADATVPPLYLLRSTVVLQADPAHPAVVPQVSQAIGDASDRPGPYQFPLALPVNLPPGWSGAATVTLEGMDWMMQTVVIARGTTTATLVGEKTTEASLTLTAVAGGGPGGDGGEGDARTDAATDAVDAAID